jgi:hypothetical protein
MSLVVPARRGLLLGILAAGVAPALVRAESLMRGRGLIVPSRLTFGRASCYVDIPVEPFPWDNIELKPIGLPGPTGWQLWGGIGNGYTATLWRRANDGSPLSDLIAFQQVTKGYEL